MQLNSLNSRVALLGSLVVTTLIGFVGCVQVVDADPGIDAGDGAEGKNPIIVGSTDWQEVTTLPDASAERANSRAVAYLDLPVEGARCTAFLIAPDVVMTNRHCIPDAAAARGARALFRYETGGPTDDAGFDCSTFLGNDAGLDYALLQCAGRPGDTYGVLELDATHLQRNADIYVLHQNCDWHADASCAPTKKYSPGRITGASGVEYAHDADTLPGSSGSPLFSRVTHTVVGIHHVGLGDDGSGHGSENRAVAMTDIVPVLHQRYPGLSLGARAPVQGPSVATTADGYEPNDTLRGATPVAAPFTSVDAHIDANDEDNFAFAAHGAFTAHIDFTMSVGNLDLYVYDSEGHEFGRSIGTTNVEDVAGSFEGNAIVRIVGYRGATGTYVLRVQ